MDGTLFSFFFSLFSMAGLMLTFVMVDSRSSARRLEVLCVFNGAAPFHFLVISYGSYFLHGSYNDNTMRAIRVAVRNKGLYRVARHDKGDEDCCE